MQLCAYCHAAASAAAGVQATAGKLLAVYADAKWLAAATSAAAEGVAATCTTASTTVAAANITTAPVAATCSTASVAATCAAAAASLLYRPALRPVPKITSFSIVDAFTMANITKKTSLSLPLPWLLPLPMLLFYHWQCHMLLKAICYCCSVLQFILCCKHLFLEYLVVCIHGLSTSLPLFTLQVRPHPLPLLMP